MMDRSRKSKASLAESFYATAGFSFYSLVCSPLVHQPGSSSLCPMPTHPLRRWPHAALDLACALTTVGKPVSARPELLMDKLLEKAPRAQVLIQFSSEFSTAYQVHSLKQCILDQAIVACRLSRQSQLWLMKYS